MAIRTAQNPPRVALVDGAGNLTRQGRLWLQQEIQDVLNQKTDALPSGAGKIAQFSSDGNLESTGKTPGSFADRQHNHQTDDQGGKLIEAALNLSDVLTGNVSSAKHGFIPKFPNDADKFFRGDGTYAIPPRWPPYADATPPGVVPWLSGTIDSYTWQSYQTSNFLKLWRVRGRLEITFSVLPSSEHGIQFVPPAVPPESDYGEQNGIAWLGGGIPAVCYAKKPVGSSARIAIIEWDNTLWGSVGVANVVIFSILYEAA